tara:strand:- start:446 stop:733 length:288 start_codon:yes stop_codon:yes gene_type:complete
MKDDIVSKIEADFEDPQEVFETLEALESMNRGPISDRMCRSIVFLVNGDRDKLHHYIDLAFLDPRDLLWQAEYEDPEIKKYDFSKSFGEQDQIQA